MKMISIKEKIPENGQYVLAYISGRPWSDRDDPKGNRFFRVLKCEVLEGKILRWKEFGPGSFTSDEIKYWFPLNGFKS